MKLNLLIILTLFSITICYSQTNVTTDRIDSLCNFINSKDTQALRVIVKYRNITETEWQRFYIDTLENKILKVFLRVDQSKTGYKYYFYDKQLIRIDENTYDKNKIISSTYLYFNKNKFLLNSKSRQSNNRIRSLVKRSKEFLDYSEYVYLDK